MYDKNGLALTPMGDSKNSYLYTAMIMGTRKVSAYARVRKEKGVNFLMASIGMFDDPRDAAFIAQEFAKAYNVDQTTQMKVDGTFREISKEFIKNTEIPEWQFPAEGLTFEELEGEGADGYMFNYVNNAKDALREVVQMFKLKAPAVKAIPALITKVEELVKGGETYRAAARKTMGC